MKWWDKILEWGFQREADNQFQETLKQKKVIDPNEVTIENAYKTRWIWYHTILAIGIFMTNVLLIAILMILAIKL
jgi:hypothetical protein